MKQVQFSEFVEGNYYLAYGVRTYRCLIFFKCISYDIYQRTLIWYWNDQLSQKFDVKIEHQEETTTYDITNHCDTYFLMTDAEVERHILMETI